MNKEKKEEKKKELTKEERAAEVEAQIFSRDMIEVEKAMIRLHQANVILSKRRDKFNLESIVHMTQHQIKQLMLVLFIKGGGALLSKHKGILKSLDGSPEGINLVEEWKAQGLIE